MLMTTSPKSLEADHSHSSSSQAHYVRQQSFGEWVECTSNSTNSDVEDVNIDEALKLERDRYIGLIFWFYR